MTKDMLPEELQRQLRSLDATSKRQLEFIIAEATDLKAFMYGGYSPVSEVELPDQTTNNSTLQTYGHSKTAETKIVRAANQLVITLVAKEALVHTGLLMLLCEKGDNDVE